MTEQLLDRITSQHVDTPRLSIYLLERGPEDGIPVLFIHGNVASSRFFEETLVALPSCYRGLAPDLRGFGESESKPVDGTRGLKDFSDDLHALVEALGYGIDQKKIHLVGWSLGGGIAMQYVIDYPTEIASLTLIGSMPPYGMLGTKDIEGTPCWPDYAGSGGGFVDREFVSFLSNKLEDDPKDPNNPSSPRNVLNRFYFKPPFRSKREDVFVSEMLKTAVDGNNYPGDTDSSPYWPGSRPGTKGVLNAISPKYCNLENFVYIDPKPPVLWVHGSHDQVVSNNSLADPATLGQLKVLPGWPGKVVYPPQPMIDQIYALLDSYKLRKGAYQEALIPDCGHSPHIEKPEAFQQAFLSFLDIVDRAIQSSSSSRGHPQP